MKSCKRSCDPCKRNNSTKSKSKSRRTSRSKTKRVGRTNSTKRSSRAKRINRKSKSKSKSKSRTKRTKRVNRKSKSRTRSSRTRIDSKKRYVKRYARRSTKNSGNIINKLTSRSSGYGVIPLLLGLAGGYYLQKKLGSSSSSTETTSASSSTSESESESKSKRGLSWSINDHLGKHMNLVTNTCDKYTIKEIVLKRDRILSDLAKSKEAVSLSTNLGPN